jgi:hypothetical protein
MSTTKWEEIKLFLRTFKLTYRTKLITDLTVSEWTHAGAYEPHGYIDNHGPVVLLEVEWLEIDPHYRLPRPYVGPDRFIDYTSVVDEKLRRIGAPFTREDNVYRIWGHVPNGVYPKLLHGTRSEDAITKP